LCASLEANGSENVRILQHDVIDVINNQLADESLDGVHIFFPDPWQKKKHTKRRLLTPEFLRLIYPKIKKGGFIHVATDWVPYAEFALKSFAQVAEYQGGEVERPAWRPVTRFEGQGLDKDHRVTDMRFTKI
jgi:tRNA (guanine-N7-)-methyltransferase